jgi:hypothetical protein
LLTITQVLELALSTRRTALIQQVIDAALKFPPQFMDHVDQLAQAVLKSGRYVSRQPYHRDKYRCR